jgi:cell division protein FtsQ
MHRSRATAPSMSFTLQVPKGDRRKKPRSRTSQGAGWVVVTAIVAASGFSAAVATGMANASALGDVKNNAQMYVTSALIAAGFGIDQVSLTGQRYTLDSAVFDALDLGNVKTFAALDMAAALKRIERISWVDTAQISRVFPGMLNVQISERIPAAIWSRGNKNYLIDATGRTLGPVSENNGWVLPRLAGEGANVDAPLLLTAIARHKDIEAQFDHAERIAERRWSVALANGSRIELAADREVEGLDQVAASSTLRQAVLGAATVVDVRTAGRAVMRPAAPSGVQAATPSRTSMVQAR